MPSHLFALLCHVVAEALVCSLLPCKLFVYAPLQIRICIIGSQDRLVVAFQRFKQKRGIHRYGRIPSYLMMLLTVMGG
jgi:hypothetical protein